MYRNNWLPEVFDDFFYNGNMNRTNATAPALNVKETPEKYQLEIAAAGMRKENFDVSLNAEGNLNIKMQNTKQHEENVKYLRREFAYGTYQQTIVLPEDVNKEKIAASVQDGILTVDLPKMNKEDQKIERQISVM